MSSNITLSNRVQSIKPSPTIAISGKAIELKAAGKDIIGLSVGEPDFDTPDFISEAGIDAIKSGKTRYTALDGTAELKAAIVGKLKRENDLSYDAKQVMVSSGAKQVIYNLMQALLNEGDEVVIPAPYWVSYPDMAILAGAKPVIVSAGPQARYKITAEQLEAAITDKTKLFLINSPSNPSGMAYTKEELAALGAVLEKHPHVIVASDDIYEHILWSQDQFVNIVNACPALYDRTLVINGMSKGYCMTGWRIGYAAGPADLIAGMKKIQSQSTSNACSISQAATTAALNGDQGFIKEMLVAFKERHDFVVERANKIPGINCLPGDGTFYSFMDVSKAIDAADGINDDVEFAGMILEKAGVAVVPGSAFGIPGCIRLSYATNIETLTKALDRIEQALTA